MPITVIKGASIHPASPNGWIGTQTPLQTKPGDLHRFFWNVPHGATWASTDMCAKLPELKHLPKKKKTDLILQGHHDDRPRVYMIHGVQIQQHATHKKGAMKMTVALANEIKEKGYHRSA